MGRWLSSSASVTAQLLPKPNPASFPSSCICGFQLSSPINTPTRIPKSAPASPGTQLSRSPNLKSQSFSPNSHSLSPSFPARQHPSPPTTTDSLVDCLSSHQNITSIRTGTCFVLSFHGPEQYLAPSSPTQNLLSE